MLGSGEFGHGEVKKWARGRKQRGACPVPIRNFPLPWQAFCQLSGFISSRIEKEISPLPSLNETFTTFAHAVKRHERQR